MAAMAREELHGGTGDDLLSIDGAGNDTLYGATALTHQPWGGRAGDRHTETGNAGGNTVLTFEGVTGNDTVNGAGWR